MAVKKMPSFHIMSFPEDHSLARCFFTAHISFHLDTLQIQSPRTGAK